MWGAHTQPGRQAEQGCRSMRAPAREYLQRVAVHQAHCGHREARADRQNGPRLAPGRIPDDYPVERPQRLQRQRQAPAHAVHGPCQLVLGNPGAGPARFGPRVACFLQAPAEGACLLLAGLHDAQ